MDRQKALQLTAVSEIEEIRVMLKALKVEARDHAENLPMMESSEEQILILLIGRIIRYIKQVWKNFRLLLKKTAEKITFNTAIRTS